MFCGYCGKRLRDDATFCSFCGKPTANRPVPEPAPAETERLVPDEQPITETVYMHDGPTKQSGTAVTEPLQSGRTNPVYTFVSVPAEWECNASPRTSPKDRPIAEQRTENTAGAVKEKAAHYGELAKEKAVQYSTIAKEQAIKMGEAAKETAVRLGGTAKEQAKKLNAAAKEKATEGVGKLQTMPKKRIEKNAFSVISVSSLLSLLLIVLAAFVPYCRIAYSADRAANMTLVKLIFGGTYTMGSTNPLQFTLKAHPELIALLLLPLLVLMIQLFRKKKTRLWAASGILFAVGLTVVIWNRTALRQMQDIVSDLSPETFEKHVVSMNGVVIKWLQNVLQGNLSFAGTFSITGRIGRGLIGLFGWSALLIGAAGMVLCMILLLASKRAKQATSPEPAKSEPNEDDDVPELSGEWL